MLSWNWLTGEKCFFSKPFISRNAPLGLPDRFQLPFVIVNNPNRGSEPKLQRPLPDLQSVLGVANPPAQHGSQTIETRRRIRRDLFSVAPLFKI